MSFRAKRSRVCADLFKKTADCAGRNRLEIGVVILRRTFASTRARTTASSSGHGLSHMRTCPATLRVRGETARLLRRRRGAVRQSLLNSKVIEDMLARPLAVLQVPGRLSVLKGDLRSFGETSCCTRSKKFWISTQH
jgi:hypothetical protein